MKKDPGCQAELIVGDHLLGRRWALSSSLFAREFWFREADEVCIYSQQAVELEPGAELQPGLAPLDGVPVSEQPPGTYLPPGRETI
jgi:hypothetical protein